VRPKARLRSSAGQPAHAIVGGATGSGKSGGLNEPLANLAACGNMVVWAIDLKRAVELRPWAPCLDRLATTPAEATALPADAVTILFRPRSVARRSWQAQVGTLTRHAGPGDHHHEYAELADDAPEAMSDTDTIARLGRAPPGLSFLGHCAGSRRRLSTGEAGTARLTIFKGRGYSSGGGLCGAVS
jgi:hypothetical protein